MGSFARLGMAPRMPHLTMQQFQDHWAGEHARVASRLPGLRSYVQYRVRLTDGRPALPYAGFDACSQLRFDDWAAMEAAFESEVFRGDVQRDEASFVDKTRFAAVAGEELVVSGGGTEDELRAPAVRVLLWRALPGREDVVTPLAERPLPAGAEGRRLLVADHARSAEGRLPVAADVVEYCTFDGEDAAERSMTVPDGGSDLLAVAGRLQCAGAMIATAHRVV